MAEFHVKWKQITAATLIILNWIGWMTFFLRSPSFPNLSFPSPGHSIFFNLLSFSRTGRSLLSFSSLASSPKNFYLSLTRYYFTLLFFFLKWKEADGSFKWKEKQKKKGIRIIWIKISFPHSGSIAHEFFLFSAFFFFELFTLMYEGKLFRHDLSSTAENSLFFFFFYFLTWSFFSSTSLTDYTANWKVENE